MSRNPLGLHIQAQGKGFDRAALLAHVKRANYLTCSVLDDQQLAIDLDIPYAVFRAYGFEPDPGTNPKTAALNALGKIGVWAASHHGGYNILYNINCEQGWSKARNDMYCEMIEASVAYGKQAGASPVGLVVGNYGSGTIKSGQGDDPNWWATPDAERLLRTLDKYRDVKLANGSYAFVLGVHEYTGIHPWIASNGAEKRLKPFWHDRPTSIDWNKAQWHLGRAAQGIIAACQKYGIQPPRMLITECLIDDMDDVAYTFGNRTTGLTGLKTSFGMNKKARGWRSLIPQWKEWYPGHDVEGGGLYAEMLAWTWETIYKPLGFVIGMNTYTWGSTGDWETFRVDNAPGYTSTIEAYAAGVVTPTPPPPPVPTPTTTAPAADDLRWYDTDAYVIGNERVPIYSDKRSSSEVIGWFQAAKASPKRIKAIFIQTKEDNAFFPIISDGVRGWALRSFIVHGEPPVVFSATDPRFLPHAVSPVGGVSAVVRSYPSLGNNVIGTLQVGQHKIDAIPFKDLTPLEQTFVRRPTGIWAVVRHVAFGVGVVDGDTVTFTPYVEPPPPIETVVITVKRHAELLQTEQEYKTLQAKWVAREITISQIARQIADKVAAKYDEAANILQGTVGVLNEAIDHLTELSNHKEETLQ